MSTIKRVYFYTVSLLTLGMFSAGTTILLRLIFDITIKGDDLVSLGGRGYFRDMLSLGLAMLIVGGTLWFLHWRAIQRQVYHSPAEVESTIRKLFLNLVLAVSALVDLYALIWLLEWLMSGVSRSQFESVSLATILVTSTLWYYHWRVEEREGQPSPEAKTVRRWRLYILSAWGLVLLSAGLVRLINNSVLHLPIWGLG